ncbi:MAG: ABC transporter permease [Deltaproteobacteria bacterium]|nr:ABC transporter permease [Deltaproteobacteria bacterium]
MQRYIAQRLVQAVVTIFLMSIIVFLMGRMTGDPATLLMSQYSTEDDRIEITKRLGLDKPLPEQYLIFITDALHGDFGRSVKGDRRPALEIVLERLPASLKLAAVSLVIGLLFGLALGITSAIKRGSALDTAARVFALFGQSIPVFLLGIVLMYVFAVLLHWLPTSGYGGFKYYILPAITMSWFTVAAITRLARTSMLDVLNCEYIKLARIKGLSESVVILKHALRNSLIPVITFMGTFFVIMITGAVVIETVFSWPGIGRLAVETVMDRNFPILQTIVLFMTTLYIFANLFVDILYAYVDPRIRYDK